MSMQTVPPLLSMKTMHSLIRLQLTKLCSLQYGECSAGVFKIINWSTY